MKQKFKGNYFVLFLAIVHITIGIGSIIELPAIIYRANSYGYLNVVVVAILGIINLYIGLNLYNLKQEGWIIANLYYDVNIFLALFNFVRSGFILLTAILIVFVSLICIVYLFNAKVLKLYRVDFILRKKIIVKIILFGLFLSIIIKLVNIGI